jgi:TPR repeat protein
MRTSDVVMTLGLLGVAFGLTPAVSFDGTRTPETAPVSTPLPPSGTNPFGGATPLAPVPVPGSLMPPGPLALPPRQPQTKFEAFRSGTQSLREGKVEQGIAELEVAASQNVAGAIWKLGRMYADGDGVPKNKARAFEYFRRLTNHPQADDSVGTPQARFVANAFVTLGQYHLEGIPEAVPPVPPDPAVAYQMFRYAASYLADSEAQYNLGRLYLYGRGAPKDAMQAARWLRLAANKGEHRAQALLGALLFKGQEVSRQAALGLFWLTVAKDGATADEGWIAETHASANAHATDEERALALKYLENWVKSQNWVKTQR